MFDVYYSYRRMERALCQRAGLYPGQAHILSALSAHEGCSVKELTELCGLGIASVSVSVRGMEEQGLVRKGGGKHGRPLYLTGDAASGRHISLGGLKKQVLNDMSWALASGYVAGAAMAKRVLADG